MEFNTYSSRSKHLPRLIYSHALWSSSIFLHCLLCIDKPYHVQTHSSLCNLQEKVSKSSLFKKKNYRSVCVVAFWWFHHRNKRQSSELSHFTFTSIHCNRDQQKECMMIDSGYRRQITKQVNLWLLPFDYAHTALSHITPKYIAVYSIDYAYSFKFSFRTSCGTQIHLTLTSRSHKQIFAWLLSIEIVCDVGSFFVLEKEKGVGQYNMMRKSGLRVRLGWILSFLFFVWLSVLDNANCRNTQMSIDMCTREYWSTELDAFDVTNLIWINRNEYFPFLMRESHNKSTDRCFIFQLYSDMFFDFIKTGITDEVTSCF